MSPLLRFLENEAQLASLAFMAGVYALRIAWLMRFRRPRERALAEGSERAAIIRSLAAIARPGALASTTEARWLHVEFLIFHLGVTAAIAASFIIPYRPSLVRVRPVTLAFQAVLAAAVVVGLLRLVRRLRRPALRRISSADDFFSLGLMIVYFASASLAISAARWAGEWPRIFFFGLTAFFLVYVPFSKISHYLYYPFARCVLGKALGYRGVLSRRRPEFGGAIQDK